MPASCVLHTAIYTLIMNARFLRYRLAFSDALVQLCVVRGLLDELSERALSSHDQALAAVWADEVGPEIRYCAHEMGRAKAYDVDGIVNELQKQHRSELVQDCEKLLKELEEETRRAAGGESGKKRLEALLWEGQPVPVRIPELVDILLKVQEAETKLSLSQAANSQGMEGDKGKTKHGQGVRAKKGVAAYDAVLLTLSDAEEVARKLAEMQQVRSKRVLTFFSISADQELQTDLPHFSGPCWDARHALCARLYRLPIALASHPERPASLDESARVRDCRCGSSRRQSNRGKTRQEATCGRKAVSCCCQALGYHVSEPFADARVEHCRRQPGSSHRRRWQDVLHKSQKVGLESPYFWSSDPDVDEGAYTWLGVTHPSRSMPRH
jgi:hypothetical protein